MRKNRTLRIRVSNEEYESIANLAKTENKNISTFIRDSVLNHELVIDKIVETKMMMGDLKRKLDTIFRL